MAQIFLVESGDLFHNRSHVDLYTTAHMGQATPASRCEPTFSSSETPALLVPEQHPCDVSGRLRSGSGTAFKMSIQPITNHQSPEHPNKQTKQANPSAEQHPLQPVFVPSLYCWGLLHAWASFTICLFISPDLDGYRAPQIRRYVSRGINPTRWALPEHSLGTLHWGWSKSL